MAVNCHDIKSHILEHEIIGFESSSGGTIITGDYSSERIFFETEQIGHPYGTGSTLVPVYQTVSGWLPAQADDSDTLAIAFITSGIDVDNIELTIGGRAYIESHGLTPLHYYFLDDQVAGDLTITYPSGVCQPLLWVEDENTVILWKERPTYNYDPGHDWLDYVPPTSGIDDNVLTEIDGDMYWLQPIVSGHSYTHLEDGSDELMLQDLGSGAVVSGFILESDGLGGWNLATASAGVSVGGTDTQIQFNDDGALGGTTGITWDKSTSIFSGSAAVTFSNPGTGTGSEKFGNLSDTSTYTYCTAIGYLAKCFGGSATAIGRQTIAYGASTVLGATARCYSTDSVAIGDNAACGNSYGVAVGKNSKIDLRFSVVLGYGAWGKKDGNIVIGQSALAEANYGMAIGRFSKASGIEGYAFGHYAYATAEEAIAIGYYANAGHTNSLAIGTSATTTAANQFMLGTSADVFNLYSHGSARFTALNVASPTVPASAGAIGTTGDISWDSDYIYVCTATDTWKRTAISTW